MFHVDNGSGTPMMPPIAPVAVTVPQWFTEGGPGEEPSIPGADTWNIWQAELLNILTAANVVPDKFKLNQIAEAIQLLIGKGIGDAGLAAEDHGHEIADVEGLSEALDGKAAKGHTHTPGEAGAAPKDHTHTAGEIGAIPTVIELPNGVDLNTIKTSGFYGLGTGAVNKPSGSSDWGTLIVNFIPDVGMQMFTNYVDGKTWLRQHNPNLTPPWDTWFQLYTSAHKPSPGDIGAVASDGRTPITGNLSITPDAVYGLLFKGSTSSNAARGAYYDYPDGTIAGGYGMEWFGAGEVITGFYVGGGANAYTVSSAWFRAQPDGKLYANGASRIYHQGFKPTPADIGLFTTVDTTDLVAGTTYTNTTEKPMYLTWFCNIETGNETEYTYLTLYINGATACETEFKDGLAGTVAGIVPIGATYKVVLSGHTSDLTFSHNATRTY